MVTAGALLYTLSLTPFEAAFLPPTLGAAAWGDPWFLVNRCLDLIFIFDMLLQFFIAYQQEDILGGFSWVEDQRLIAKNYITTWFSLDAAVIFVPGVFELMLAAQSADDGAANTLFSDASVLRTLRVVRLAKLGRLLRASRLYRRWQTKITVSSSTQTIVQCTLLLCVGAHWAACLIGIQTALHRSPSDTWLGPSRYDYCDSWGVTTGGVTGAVEAEREASRIATWAAPLARCDIRLGSWYLASLTWALMLITGTGGTDYYPSSDSDAETIVVCAMVLCGALLWTYVLALFCDMATNSNPGLTQFRQLLDGLNIFINAHRLPRPLAHRLREFLHQQKPGQLGKYAEKAIPVLSPALQVEVILFVHRRWLENTWFLKGLEPSCLVRLAREMVIQTLAPGEVAPRHNLYVVTRGLVLYGGRVLTRGQSWGDDVILSDQRYFLPYHARAMTYADVMVLDREKLTQVLCLFPESATRLRKKVIRLALRRHLIDARRSFIKKQRAGMGRQRRASFMESLEREDASTTGEERDREDASFKATLEAHRRMSQESFSRKIKRLPSSLAGLSPRRRKSQDAESESACRSSAVELALLLQDKQISQQEWRGGNHGGQDQSSNMAHSETMAALALITDELKSLRKDVKALQEGAIVGGLHSTRTRAGLSGADQGAIAADEQPSADRTDINDGGCVTAGTSSRAAADDEPSYSSRPSLPSINSRALSRARLHRRCKPAPTSVMAGVSAEPGPGSDPSSLSSPPPDS